MKIYNFRELFSRVKYKLIFFLPLFSLFKLYISAFSLSRPYFLSNSLSISATIFGLAFPFVADIVWPIKY